MYHIQKTSEYITNAWQFSIKKRDKNPDFILPYEFIPPCISGSLTDLFYWDTYFTNKGLYADGMAKYAYQNIENLKYCLRIFKCVPNMCTKGGADYASQPPLLALMVKDYFEYFHDLEFLKDSVEALELEYEFWMKERITPTGLNRYGTNFDFAKYGTNLDGYAKRVGLDISTWTEAQKVDCEINKVSEGESGEDHTPRFNLLAAQINPIDLNAYLYAFECLLSEFSSLVGKDAKVWQERAKLRKERIKKYCFDPQTGVYFDYDFKKNERTGIYCVACYLPFVFGIHEDKNEAKRAVEKINAYLVRDFGVASCQEVEKHGQHYQWGYPNAWAPHNYWACVANQEVGLNEKAEEIRFKWLNTVATEFEKSGKLYEKYDAVVGGKATINEYGLPEMLGWTAGIFQAFYKNAYTMYKTK